MGDLSEFNKVMEDEKYDVMLDSLSLQFLPEVLLPLVKTLYDHSVPGKTLLLHRSMAPGFNTPMQPTRMVASLTDEQFGFFLEGGFETLAQDYRYRDNGQAYRLAIFRA